MSFQVMRDHWMERAEKAEARVAELESLLGRQRRELLDEICAALRTDPVTQFIEHRDHAIHFIRSRFHSEEGE